MSWEVAAAKLLSRKETRDNIQKLMKIGAERIYSKGEIQIGSKVENLYPGLKRGSLPDCLAHLETRKPTRNEISAERQGAKLTTDVAQRLWNEKITPKAWENANFDGRKQMLLYAKQVIGQEMLLSPELRQNLKINVVDNSVKKSDISGRLVKENGKIKIEAPQIEINSELLNNNNCEEALEALYHEMIHVEQIDSILDLKATSKEAKHLSELLGTESHTTIDSLKNPIENEAYGQAHVFKMAYEGEKIKHPTEVSSKQKEVVKQKEFTTSTELHADKIKELFRQSPELQFNQWNKMDLHQRLQSLQRFEDEIAKIEQRNPVQIFCENLPDGTNGYHSQNADGTERIVLSSKLLNSVDYNGYRQSLKTLLHEGRHAYQFYNLKVKQTEPSDELIKQWRINKDYFGYQRSDASLEGYYRYFIQPIETDARIFADTAIKKMGL